MFKTHHQKEIVNLYSVDPNETISTAKYEISSWREEVKLTLLGTGHYLSPGGGGGGGVGGFWAKHDEI